MIFGFSYLWPLRFIRGGSSRSFLTQLRLCKSKAPHTIPPPGSITLLRTHKLFVLFAVVMAAGLLHTDFVLAQSFRYMDEAGNLHWVDSVDDIPRRYRGQVLVPTPVPIYPKGWKQPRLQKTKKPKPTKKPRLSLQEKQATKRALQVSPAAQAEPNSGEAPNSATPPNSIPDQQRAAVEGEVAFDGAVAESSMVIVTRP